MGTVIRLKRKLKDQPEVVEFVKALLTRAEMGLVSGIICLASIEGDENEIGLCGDFSEDAEYAVRAAGRGLAALVAQQNGSRRHRRAAPRPEEY